MGFLYLIIFILVVLFVIHILVKGNVNKRMEKLLDDINKSDELPKE